MNIRIKQIGLALGVAGVVTLGVVGTMGQYVPPTSTLPPCQNPGERPEWDGSAWGCKSTAPAWPTGSYVFLPNATNTSTNASLGIGSLRVAPFYVRQPTVLDQIGAEVSTIGEAGSKFRICVYDTGTDGRPHSLVKDAGQIAGDSATVQFLTTTTTFSSSGTYWAGGAVQDVVTTQPTIRSAPAGSAGATPITFLSAPTAGQVASGYLMSGVTSSCPATFVASDVQNSFPRIIGRVQ